MTETTCPRLANPFMVEAANRPSSPIERTAAACYPALQSLAVDPFRNFNEIRDQLQVDLRLRISTLCADWTEQRAVLEEHAGIKVCRGRLPPSSRLG